MAKIVYWESPIDPTKTKSFSSDKNIRKILEELGIENKTLSLSINGEFPDDVDLDYSPEKTDIIEIRKIVEGNNDAEGKNLAANIITIAALVAITVLSGGTTSPLLLAAIGIGAGVASGALRYRAAKILARSGNLDKGDFDTNTNNFSINAANNESRPLQSLPVPMGSHRFAPDYAGQPYPGFSGGVSSLAAVNVDNALNPINILTDLPSMQTVPAGYLSRPITWPAYDVKLIPQLDLATLNSLTQLQREELAPFFPTPLIGVPYSDVSMPIVIYHHDINDPYYGRFNLWACIEIQDLTGKTLPEAINEYEAWFDYSYALTTSWYFALMSDYFTFDINNIFSFRSFWKLFYLDFTSQNLVLGQLAFEPGANTVTNQTENFPRFITEVINGGNSFPTNKSGFIPFRSTELVRRYTEPQSRDVIQIFNYGLGDLTVSDRAIEKTPLSEIIGFINDPIDKFTSSPWRLPDIFTTFPPRPAVTNVKLLEAAVLVNNTEFSGPEAIVGPIDFSLYNFVFRSTPRNCYRVEIDFEGSLYTTSGSGLQENITTIEIQYRQTGDTAWDNIKLEQFRNSTTQPTRQTATFNFPLGGSKEYEFRIRKLIKDSNNNEDERSAQINMVAFKCFIGASIFNPEASDLVGQTVESLFLTANSQTSGQTNKFSAQVDAKCWVYDSVLDEWNWELSRNPAWWFLYFARGGFKNQLADGNYLFPFSPTYGWVNGPGHPDSTEIMFGCGLQDDEIDIEGIIEWANFCDTNDLFLDVVFRDDATSSEILEKIANVGRGSTSYYKGVLGVVFENPAQVPTGLYGMGNIIEGSFSVDYSVINVPSKIIGNYVDRDDDWEAKTVEALVPFSNTDNLNFLTITLDGVTEEQQAQREVNILAARQYFQKRVYTWKVDHEGLIAKRGDLVYLSHDSTQYGYSGRIVEFLYSGGVITGIKTTTEFKDNDVSFVSIRRPNGEIQTYACSVDGCDLIFIHSYALEDAPQYPDGTLNFDNALSDFQDSYPDDFIYLASPLATPGKIVRIAEIKSDQNMIFTLTAVDEDPAMWSYEYGPSTSPESFDDSLILTRVFNVGYKKISDGIVKIFWEIDGGDFVKIINLADDSLIESNGLMSFSSGEVTIELSPGLKYNLRIEPFVIGAPYKSEGQNLVIWS